MAFELPKLPYQYNALEPHIDEETMRIHYEKHHGTYVEKLNSAVSENKNLSSMDAEDLMRNINKVPDSIKQAVINNGGGHVNHNLFWNILTPGGKEASEDFLDKLKPTFSDLNTLKSKLKEEALNRFGSGWAWLVVENGKLHVCSTPNQDSPLMKRNTPIMGIDVWEHAYYLKYQNKRADYIDAFWNVVDWQKVEENLNNAS
jgi:superoxide dismutase, Fe-Mn family